MVTGIESVDSLLRSISIHARDNNYVKVIECYNKIHEIGNCINNIGVIALALHNLAVTYNHLGEYDKAIDYLMQILPMAKSANHTFAIAKTYLDLGEAYLGLDEYSKAISYCEMGLTISKELNEKALEMIAWGSLSNAYRFNKDYQKGVECVNNSIKIAEDFDDKYFLAKGYGTLGSLYCDLGDYSGAALHAQMAYDIYSEYNLLIEQGKQLNNLANALRKCGELDAAENNLKKAILIFDDYFKNIKHETFQYTTLLEYHARSYRLLQQILVNKGNYLEALEICEKIRDCSLVELLSNKKINENANTIPSTVDLSQIKKIAKTNKLTIICYSILFDKSCASYTRSPSQQSQLLIWLIKPDGNIVFHEVDLFKLWNENGVTLTGLVSHTRKLIDSSHSSIQECLCKLYELLISPIADDLPINEGSLITIIPDSTLSFMPFAALLNDNKYFIERYRVQMCSSFKMLNNTYQISNKNKSILGDSLVIGNPSFEISYNSNSDPPNQLPSLPHAQAEANAIAKLLKTDAIIGKQATKKAFFKLMENARYIHLATHGLLNDNWKDEKIPGVILLTPTEDDDGFLTSNEIMTLNLKNTEMVVLSACNTGLGKNMSDGSVGLSRSWLSAGIPTVVSSLWSVSDESTKYLMIKFYEFLNDQNKSDALRNAMLFTKLKYPKLRDWAAFVLMGNPI